MQFCNTCVPDHKPRRAWQPLRRSVTALPRRAEPSRAANKPCLDALASTQAGTPLGEVAAPLCRPLTCKAQRYSCSQRGWPNRRHPDITGG